jgi:hypothetical protein
MSTVLGIEGRLASTFDLVKWFSKKNAAKPSVPFYLAGDALDFDLAITIMED